MTDIRTLPSCCVGWGTAMARSSTTSEAPSGQRCHERAATRSTLGRRVLCGLRAGDGRHGRRGGDPAELEPGRDRRSTSKGPCRVHSGRPKLTSVGLHRSGGSHHGAGLLGRSRRADRRIRRDSAADRDLGPAGIRFRDLGRHRLPAFPMPRRSSRRKPRDCASNFHRLGRDGARSLAGASRVAPAKKAAPRTVSSSSPEALDQAS